MAESGTTALVMVHCQVGFVEGIEGLGKVHDADVMLARLGGLLARARKAGAPVVFLEETSEPETDGPIHPDLAPRPGEVVVRTNGPDVFGEPHLRGVLEALGAESVIVAGFQSEICIASTVGGAADHGFAVTLAGDSHSTFDLEGEEPAEGIIATHNLALAEIAEVVESGSIEW